MRGPRQKHCTMSFFPFRVTALTLVDGSGVKCGGGWTMCVFSLSQNCHTLMFCKAFDSEQNTAGCWTWQRPWPTESGSCWARLGFHVRPSAMWQHVRGLVFTADGWFVALRRETGCFSPEPTSTQTKTQIKGPATCLLRRLFPCRESPTPHPACDLAETCPAVLWRRHTLE